MDYRAYLKEHLDRRRELNPRYSLRAFAKKLGLSPSKLSEILSGKKDLSRARAQEIASRLGLMGSGSERFLLLIDLAKAKTPAERRKLQAELKAREGKERSGLTTQRNAWYFGAVAALDEAGLDAASHAKALGIEPLQVENARRFVKRLSRIYENPPSLQFEPVSLLKKLGEAHMAKDGATLDADFLFLDDEELAFLREEIATIARKLRAKGRRRKDPGRLHLVHWGFVKLMA